ncbi:hypothetical protein SDJN03_01876, partial [Cucurbita argyrosperma subsp. sororia]
MFERSTRPFQEHRPRECKLSKPSFGCEWISLFNLEPENAHFPTHQACPIQYFQSAHSFTNAFSTFRPHTQFSIVCIITSTPFLFGIQKGKPLNAHFFPPPPPPPPPPPLTSSYFAHSEPPILIHHFQPCGSTAISKTPLRVRIGLFGGLKAMDVRLPIVIVDAKFCGFHWFSSCNQENFSDAFMITSN